LPVFNTGALFIPPGEQVPNSVSPFKLMEPAPVPFCAYKSRNALGFWVYILRLQIFLKCSPEDLHLRIEDAPWFFPLKRFDGNFSYADRFSFIDVSIVPLYPPDSKRWPQKRNRPAMPHLILPSSSPTTVIKRTKNRLKRTPRESSYQVPGAIALPSYSAKTHPISFFCPDFFFSPGT